MSFDSALFSRLLAFVVPIVIVWISVGLAMAVLYHLSLIFLGGEFRVGRQKLLDLLVSVLRSVFLVLAWPFILSLDRSVLSQIRLFLLYLDPRQRKENEDVQDALAETAYWRWVQRTFVEQRDLECRRKKEIADERKKLLQIYYDDNPELETIWMLTGVGSHPTGVRQLVRMYPDYYLADEILASAKREVELRRPWSCLRCGYELRPDSIELPELFFLRILDWKTDKMLIEGWAMKGEYRMRFSPCPQCGAIQPELVEEVSRLGRASEVAEMAKKGMNLHWDLA